MEGSFDNPPIILTGRRVVGFWTTVVFILFLFVGLDTLVSDRVSPEPMAVLSVFGGLLGAVAGVWLLLAPPWLEVGPEGISGAFLWRRFRYPWSEVRDFQPVQWRGAGPSSPKGAVGFNYLGRRAERPVLWLFSGGVQALIGQPVFFRVSAQTLADLLNQARAKWGDRRDGDEASLGDNVSAESASLPLGGSTERGRGDHRALEAWIVVALLIGVTVVVPLATPHGSPWRVVGLIASQLAIPYLIVRFSRRPVTTIAYFAAIAILVGLLILANLAFVYHRRP